MIFTQSENEASNVKSSIKNYLQIEVSNKGISVTHEGYINKLLDKWKMAESKVVKDPMSTTEFDENSKPFDANLYRKLIGSLLYLSVSSRPDIAFAVNRLAQFNNKPLETHFTAAKRILRYLKATSKTGLFYSKEVSEISVRGYSDADWGSQKDRKSVSGVVIKMNTKDSPVIWRSSKQTLISLSTCEAEYIALTLLIQELKFLTNLLKSIDIEVSKPEVFTDSQSAMALIKNQIIS